MKSSTTMLLVGGAAVAAVAIYYLTKGSSSGATMQPSTQKSPAQGQGNALAQTQNKPATPADNTPDWMKTVGGYVQGAQGLDKAAGGSGNVVSDVAGLFK